MNLAKLRELGWSPLVIWECETSDREILTRVLQDHLGPPGSALVRDVVQNYE